VFARAAHLFEMIGLAANPGPQHDGFSVMRTPQGIPLVGDGALAFLREEEATEKARADRLSRARHRRSKPTGGPLDVGEAITMPAATGAWAGMTGFVAQSDPRKTVVSLSLFGRAQDIEIETFILRPNAVSADEQIAA
jgi:sirohydrochlorin ferrochelatase